MKFSYNWLQEYIKEKLPEPNKLAEILAMRVFEVESIEKKGDDHILDIKVLPNRAPDCLSYLGMAREIAGILGLKFVKPHFSPSPHPSPSRGEGVNIEILNKDLCPRYSALVIKNIKVKESPDWLKNKLEVNGLRPINNIVDATNLVMLEFGQPLHAFDFNKLSDANMRIHANDTNIRKIIVRNARKGEKITTLEGKEYNLNENILVIADEKESLAIAGIKGGKKAEIDENTKDIILESASFEASNIRKTSKELNLRTDASVRFENARDPNLTVSALDRVAILIQGIAGGDIAGGVIDENTIKTTERNIILKHSYLESLLGVEIKTVEVIKIFNRLNLKAKDAKKSGGIIYDVSIEIYRPDLQNAEDLIEEIGRLYGYENIKPEMPIGVLMPAIKNEGLEYLDKAKDILVGLGYSEVYNYSFVSEADKDFFQLKNLLEIQNPLSQEQKYLRPNLIINLIKNVSLNMKYFLPGGGFMIKDGAVRLFEAGHVFALAGDIHKEFKNLAGILHIKNANGQTFYGAKGAVETLFQKLSISDFWYDDYIEEGMPDNLKSILEPGKTAQVKIGDDLIGFVGEVKHNVLEQFKITGGSVTVFEFHFEKLAKLADEERIYQAPSKFPAIIRDLSVAVDLNIKIESVLNTIENAGGELLIDVDVFDIYEKELKTLSFHLIFQSNERNLTDGEVNSIMERIVKILEDKGWEVKK